MGKGNDKIVHVESREQSGDEWFEYEATVVRGDGATSTSRAHTREAAIKEAADFSNEDYGYWPFSSNPFK